MHVSNHSSSTGQATLVKGVPESLMKDIMPCEISPLGYHLSMSIMEKIWQGEFIDILSLLPFYKDFAFKSDRRGEDKQEEDRRRQVLQSFQNWLQAFFIYAGVMVEKHPGIGGDLFQHLDPILEAYKNFGALGCFFYDESFR